MLSLRSIYWLLGEYNAQRRSQHDCFGRPQAYDCFSTCFHRYYSSQRNTSRETVQMPFSIKSPRLGYIHTLGASSNRSGHIQANRRDPCKKSIHLVNFICREASIDATKHAYTASDPTWPTRTPSSGIFNRGTRQRALNISPPEDLQFVLCD